MATTKKTKKTTKAKAPSTEDIVLAEAGTVPDCPDTAGEGGFEFRSAEDEPCWPYDEPKKEFKDPLLTRLDRIIELLEGTLTVDRKGLKLDSPWWEKFLGKD